MLNVLIRFYKFTKS